MNYLPEISTARRVSGFVIAMRFNDGTEKHIDISQWFKGPVFRTLAWPNGVDIAPEALYSAVDLRSQPQEKSKHTHRRTPPTTK
jgi:hypothetical protein